MTALSPRLAHLLIHEDRSTGRLLMPDGRKVEESRRESGGKLTPPISPLSHSDSPASLPVILPPSHFRQDRRSSTSIFSLLNEIRPSVGTSRPAPLKIPVVPSLYHDRGLAHYVPPHTAPIASASTRPKTEHQPSSMLGPASMRPDMFRRHSAHPYESSSSRSSPYAPSTVDDFAGSGSRAPISRTTKACNACRSRKVRCDAGGLPNGEPADCGRCREAGVECVYSGPQKKRGPCPGTVRLPNGTRSRRPSHRSSVTSIATQSVTTPPSDDELPSWSERSSYGFPPSFSAKVLDTRFQLPHQSSPISVLSWPGMQPAVQLEEPKVVFRENYTMGPKACGPQTTALPPLNVAIDRRASAYDPC